MTFFIQLQAVLYSLVSPCHSIGYNCYCLFFSRNWWWDAFIHIKDQLLSSIITTERHSLIFVLVGHLLCLDRFRSYYLNTGFSVHYNINFHCIETEYLWNLIVLYNDVNHYVRYYYHSLPSFSLIKLNWGHSHYRFKLSFNKRICACWSGKIIHLKHGNSFHFNGHVLNLYNIIAYLVLFTLLNLWYKMSKGDPLFFGYFPTWDSVHIMNNLIILVLTGFYAL